MVFSDASNWFFSAYPQPVLPLRQHLAGLGVSLPGEKGVLFNSCLGKMRSRIDLCSWLIQDYAFTLTDNIAALIAALA
jgi:hypothetical protein